MFKKRLSKKISIALTVMASAAFFVGCSNKENTTDVKETATNQSAKPTKEATVNYDNETVVFVVDTKDIKVGEAMWYVYFIEDSMKEDAQSYKEDTGESYYDQAGNEEGKTVRELAKNEIVDMIYYYEIMYSMAQSLDYKIEDENDVKEQAASVMENVDSEIVKKYNLEQSYYETILTKWAMAELYREHVISNYDVDKDELMKKNYSDEEIKMLTDKEYEEIANELDSNYRVQLFNDEFSNIEQSHEIQVLSDIWNEIPIGD